MTSRMIQFIAMLLLFSTISSYGQENIFGSPQVISPEIHDDHSVTFRYWAPHADSVKVTGDFLPTERMKTPYGEMDGPGQVALIKGEEGIWTYRSTQLAPELYNYAFMVDGLKVNDPNNPFLIRDVATVANIFIISGEHADLYQVNDIPHGTVALRWYDSPGLEMDRRIAIYTPPGYEKSEEEFPVLYLLHGAGGDEEAWISLGRTAQIMDNLIHQSKAKPMIVVMPNANITQDAAPGAGSDGYYKPQFMAPGTMNGTYETSFKDVVSFVEDNYQVKKDKTQRAIAGLSMGGFHALHISRFYANTFDYVGLFSAAIMGRDGAIVEVYQNIDETLRQQFENDNLFYYLAIGKTDFLYQANQDFRKKIDDLGANYQYVESEGGHIWRNWRVYLSEFVTKLF